MDTSGQQGSTRGKGNQNIQVYLRVRPLSSREFALRSSEVVDVATNREIHIRPTLDAKTSKKFCFDRVFGVDSHQKSVYSQVVAPFIGEVLRGYNCTVFAYGQTGTGKTYTMVGEEVPELSASWEDDSPLGIIPRAVVHLFDELRMMDVEYSMRISYLELYNEELCDLLSADDSQKIRIFDDSTKKGSIIVQGLEEVPVHTKDDVYKLLAKGQERRKTASTLMNAQSSRSHTVFSILVHIKENGMDGEEMLKTGKINLVDLAGSENITKAGNEKGIRTRETVNINQSLLTLGRVITSLVERHPHVPYRESKLTRLLQESLGGRTKTSIIATISPGHKDLEETLNTLDYAHRAKNILNRPEINQRLTKKTVLKEYTEEIDKLKRDLIAAREKNGIYLPENSYNHMTYTLESQNKELNEKVHMIRALKEEMERKETICSEVQRKLEKKTRELMITSEALNKTNLVLRDTKDSLMVSEQRCEESSCLIQAYQTTEKVLTQQANQLVEVADCASSDTHGLHEALKRRKVVDGAINSTIKRFVEELQSNIESVSGNVSNFHENFLIKSNEICEEIKKNSTRHSSAADEVRNSLGAMETLNKSSSTKTREILDLFRQSLPDSLEKHHDVILKLVAEMEVNQLKYDKEMQAHMNRMKSIQQNQAENDIKAFGIFQDFAKTSKDNVEKYTEVNRKFLSDLESQLDIIVSERNEEIRKIALKNAAKINSVMETLKEIDTENRSIFTHLDRNKEDKAKIEEQNRGHIIHISDYRENFINSMSVMNADLENTKIASAAIVSEHEGAVADIRGKNEKNTKYTLEKLTEMISKSTAQQDDAKAEIEKLKDKIRENCEKSTEDFKAKFHSTLNEVTNEENRVLMSQRAVNTIVGKANVAIDTFQESVKEALQNMHTDINTLYTKDLKTYASTGETPGRKDFKYPRELVATSPHERILNRFHAKLSRATEGETSLTPEYEETTPTTASTPIHQGAGTVDPCLKEHNSIFETSASHKMKKIPSVINISSDQENTDVMDE
ncbi:Kinesin-like protein Klp61F [Sergentomyia squamirostris]